MVSFPNCKINLGLHILRKRSDNYHDIETVFYPIKWNDILEIIPSNKLKLTTSGIAIDGNMEDNLCIKAFNILKAKYQIPNVHIHLHKIVPMGAGLGGGSSDAAFTLKSINKLFNLNISNKELVALAANLGSDCSFFIENKPTLATGRGTDLSPISIDLSNYFIVVVYPQIHISTPKAYSQTKSKERAESISKNVLSDILSWKYILENDFEISVYNQFPEIENIKNEFYKQGAIYSSLSGSGSAVFGIFEKESNFITHPNYIVWKGKL